MTSRHELTPLVAAAQALVAPEVIRSVAFRKLATGALSFDGAHPELLAFKRAFERTAWSAGFPVFASTLERREIVYRRFPLERALNELELKLVLALGEMVSWQVDVPILGRAEVDHVVWQLQVHRVRKHALA